MIRLALAGGSDERPPHDEPRVAEIIRFPIERCVRSPQTPSAPVDRSPAVEDDGDDVIHPSAAAIETSSQHWPRVFPGL